ncbi:MAG: T9SS type A sorting domain-containing protein [Bacteroidetes bacterium]|nr:T9SS type A sorting domain-containing protein [Bacteroidota bacterium]
MSSVRYSFRLLLFFMLSSLPAAAQVEWPHTDYDAGVVMVQLSGVGNVSMKSIPEKNADGVWVLFVIQYYLQGIGTTDTLYVQYLDKSGNPRYPSFHLMPRFPYGISNMTDPSGVTDDAGNLYLLFGNNELRMQKIGLNGSVQFAGGGTQISSRTTEGATAVISSGNVYVVWQEIVNAQNRLFIQRLNTNGLIQWTSGNVTPAAGFVRDNHFIFFRATTDGDGGLALFYTWRDTMAWQFISPNGNRWMEFPYVLGTLRDRTHSEFTDIVYHDRSWYVAFSDMRYGAVSNSDVFLFKIARYSNGLVTNQWASDTGKAICKYQGIQNSLQLTPDNAGGMIISWRDLRNVAQQGQGYPQVFAQRWLFNDVALWTTNGTQVSSNYFSPEMYYGTPVAVNGGIVFPLDESGTGISAQKLLLSGSSQWYNNIGRVLSIPGAARLIGTVGMKNGKIIFVYRDFRNGTVQSKLLDQNGYLGENGPFIRSVRDVINDQGSKVSVLFRDSWRELNAGPSQFNANTYRVFRGLTERTMPEGVRTRKNGTAIEADAPNMPVPEMTTSAGETIYWEMMAEIAPNGLGGYSRIVPTTSDSGRQGIPWNYYITGYGNFSSMPPLVWYSNIDSGYSVDNLPPYPPQMPAGTFQNGSVVLHWRPNMEPDLGGYEVYRGTVPTFIPNDASRIGTTADTLFRDRTVPSGGNYYYLVKAVDVNGNRSDNSSIVPMQLLHAGEGAAPLPTDYALEQNYPNPFNPSTNIAFAVPAAGMVTLTVTDALGREVAMLMQGYREAGRYTVPFAASHLASGVYFCELRAEKYTKRIKMNLMK